MSNDWDMSSSMCSLLMQEALIIRQEDSQSAQADSTKPVVTAVAEHPRVCTATAQTLQSLHHLSHSKCKAIQRWVDTTFMYGGDEKPQVCRVSTTTNLPNQDTIGEEFPHHVIIDTFLPNFAYSLVGKLQIGHIGGECNPQLLYVWDTGSSENMVTSRLLESVYPHFKSLLTPYTGPDVLSCTKAPLQIMGLLHTDITIGPYCFHDYFLVYQCKYAECLIGLRTKKEHDMISTGHALLLPRSRLGKPLQGGDLTRCRRLGPPEDPLYDMEPVEVVLIPPFTAVLVQLQVSPDQVQVGQTLLSPPDLAVVHTEDFQDCTPYQVDTMQMAVWYSLVSLDEQNRCFVKYNNQTSDAITLSPGTAMAHLEKMQPATSAEVDQLGDDTHKYLRRVLTPTDEEGLSEPESRVDALDIADTPPDNINFTNPHMQSEDPTHKAWLVSLISKYKDAFSKHKFDIGAFSEESIDFSLITGARPPPCKAYKVNPLLRERATQMLNALERAGCISKMLDEDTPFISPALFLLKKPNEIPVLSGDGSRVAMAPRWTPPDQCALRLTIDFRFINSQIRVSRRGEGTNSWSRFPLPDPRAFIQSLKGKQWLSCSDFCQSFFHGRLGSNSQKLLSFCWDNIAYKMLRLPQGVRFGSSILQRFVTKLIVRHQMQEHIHVFVDNIYISGSTLQEYMTNLTKFFEIFSAAKFKMKWDKTVHFCSGKIQVLGWVLHLREGTIECHGERVRALQAMQRPNNRKTARAYVGMLNFISDCMPKCKLTLKPIYQQCGHSVDKFIWNEDCEKAFIQIRQDLAKLPVLTLPDPGRAFYILCDSCRGRGGFYTLMQRHPTTHKLHPCRYAAKAYTGAVSRYSQHKSECYILMLAITNESHWLAFSQTFIFSDAHSLIYLARYAPHNEILWNWSRLLCSYAISVIHLPATTDIIAGFADLFTRCPDTLKQTMRDKIGKHRMEDTPLVSFYGLAPIRIQDLMAILHRFTTWFDGHRLSSPEVKNAWKAFAAKETKQFPGVPQLSARLATTSVYYHPDTRIWEQDFHSVIPLYDGHQMSRQRHALAAGHGDANFSCGQATVQGTKLTKPPNSDDDRANQGGRGHGHNLGCPVEVKTNVKSLGPLPALSERAAGGATCDQIQHILTSHLPNLSKQQLAFLQTQCPMINKIQQTLKLPFVSLKGIVFKKVLSGFRLVWPSHCTTDLLQVFHKQNSIYHLKRNKLQSLVCKYFHVFNFKKAYDTMIAACKFCHLHTRARLDHKLPLGVSLHVHNPGDAWSMDFVVLNSKLNPPSALVLACMASNYLVAIPLSDKSTAKEVVTALSQHILAPFGQFLCLGSDAQSNFTSELMAEVCAIMRVRRFIVSHPRQSNAERAHRFIIWMVSALATDIGLTSELLPVYLGHCSLLYNTSTRVNDNYTPFFLMNGFRQPRLNRLVPFSAFLPTSRKADTNYLRAFIKLREALWFVGYKRRELHRKQHDVVVDFQAQLKVGDLVSLLRVRPLGARAGWKLRAKVHDGVFKVCRLYHRTALVLKYDKSMVFHKYFKQRGGIHQPQYISIDRHRLKPVKNPAAHIGLTPTETAWAHLVKILDQRCPPAKAVCLVSPDNQVAAETDLNRFFLHFDKEGAIFNDLNPKYKKELLVNRNYIHLCHSMRNGVEPTLRGDPLGCYTAGKLVVVKSSINFSHITCSYGRSSSCLRARGQADTAGQLGDLQKANLPTLPDVRQHDRRRLKNRKRRPSSVYTSSTLTEIPQGQQVDQLHEFLQNLDQPVSSQSSTNDNSSSNQGSLDADSTSTRSGNQILIGENGNVDEVHIEDDVGVPDEDEDAEQQVDGEMVLHPAAPIPSPPAQPILQPDLNASVESIDSVESAEWFDVNEGSGEEGARGASEVVDTRIPLPSQPAPATPQTYRPRLEPSASAGRQRFPTSIRPPSTGRRTPSTPPTVRSVRRTPSTPPTVRSVRSTPSTPTTVRSVRRAPSTPPTVRRVRPTLTVVYDSPPAINDPPLHHGASSVRPPMILPSGGTVAGSRVTQSDRRKEADKNTASTLPSQGK